MFLVCINKFLMSFLRDLNIYFVDVLNVRIHFICFGMLGEWVGALSSTEKV